MPLDKSRPTLYQLGTNLEQQQVPRIVMKRLLITVSAFALLLSLPVHAAVTTNFTYNSGFANGGYVPDNDLSGWSDTHTLSGFTGGMALVDNITVTLNISGGWNGDLYGYLVHVDENNNSGFVVLLNRVGTPGYTYGYGEAGFNNVTLSDVSGTSIQNYGGSSSAAAALSTGTYGSAGGTLNTSYDGLTVNGSWTLFLADMSSGDISLVNSWTLGITAVPEPTTWAMIIFGTLLGGWHFARRLRRT
jgi:subtilisin-like proprotein convertase family protein